MKNISPSPVVSIGAIPMLLVAILSSQLVLSSPAYNKDQLTAVAPNEDNEMAAADNELASLQEAPNMADGEVDESEDSSPMTPMSQRWSDNSETYEPNGQDSNIENAKIQLNAMDMATAAGHHHHHGHYVSGKMSMGAHSGHKGAFGWHAKFPVGGKGRR